MHMATLNHRLEKLFNKLNVRQSLCEFYSYGEPPDFIFYIGEVLGEVSGKIPLRMADETQQISREERWKEIRAMFRCHACILDLMDVDPIKIDEKNFEALDILQTTMPEVIQ